MKNAWHWTRQRSPKKKDIYNLFITDHLKTYFYFIISFTSCSLYFTSCSLLYFLPVTHFVWSKTGLGLWITNFSTYLNDLTSEISPRSCLLHHSLFFKEMLEVKTLFIHLLSWQSKGVCVCVWKYFPLSIHFHFHPLYLHLQTQELKHYS